MGQRLRTGQVVDLPGVLIFSKCDDGHGCKIGWMHRRTACLSVGATDDITGLDLPGNVKCPLQSVRGGYFQTQECPLQPRISDLALDVVMEGCDGVGLLFCTVIYGSRGLEDDPANPGFPGRFEECRREAWHRGQQEHRRDILECCCQALLVS